MRFHYRTAAVVLALLALYNVVLHWIAAINGWSWFESRGLIFWPTPEVYSMVNHSTVWSLYWLVGLILAIVLHLNAKTETGKSCAAALVGMTLLDVILHAAQLHASIEYPIIPRDVFWTGYWIVAMILCIRVIRQSSPTMHLR